MSEKVSIHDFVITGVKRTHNNMMNNSHASYSPKNICIRSILKLQLLKVP